MKTIDTLVDDIYALFESDYVFPEEAVEEFGKKLARHLTTRIQEEKSGSALRMSSLGEKCDRKLWYKEHEPESLEKLTPQTRFKFLYGDLLEELMLFLASQAGHKVEGEQETLEINGVPGHRDAIIDGCQVDVKSASSYGYKKFENNEVDQDDPFGYIDQNNAYLYAAKDDPRITDRDNIYFLAIDKTLGKICLDKYPANGVDYTEVVREKRDKLNFKFPPPRAYKDEFDGKSGNKKLGMACSYCQAKERCWPNLKTYFYSTGPRFLTKVVKEPRVDKEV